MSSKTIYHVHHVVPKYAGGTDDSSNLVRLTIEEHAQAHLELYHKYGNERDLLAHNMLLGQITKAEAIKVIQRLPKTEQHKKKISSALMGEKNPMYGKTISDEQKKVISEANKVPKPHVSENMKKRHTEGKAYQWTSKDNPRAHACEIDGIVYETVQLAADTLGLYRTVISYRCNSKGFQTYRFVV